MSTNTSDRDDEAWRKHDGETYGSMHSFDETSGDFRRDARGRLKTVEGLPMVAESLVRVLKTPLGDDPFRPDLGLDKGLLLGTSEAGAKRAIIQAIGPDAIPWVERLGLNDIEITRPDGGRRATIHVTAKLTDDQTVDFEQEFRELLRPREAQNDETRSYQYPGSDRGDTTDSGTDTDSADTTTSSAGFGWSTE